jgi:hypothetical protein
VPSAFRIAGQSAARAFAAPARQHQSDQTIVRQIIVRQIIPRLSLHR